MVCLSLSHFIFIANTVSVLSKSFETENPLAPVQCIRNIRHEQAEKKLFLAHKNANLKSGARGLQARKDLKAAEAKLESTQELYGIQCHNFHLHLLTPDQTRAEFRCD